MVDLKQAILIAKHKATEILGAVSSNLEEIERDRYKDHEVWSITLSVPRDVSNLKLLAQFSSEPLHYKRFLIDVQTGELVAMKLREVASQ
jgi:hypothetical protein